jgi:hypothetical protein
MKKKLLQKRMQGSITVYVLLLFGMSIVLYMFGFTNMMGGSTGAGYIDTANLDQTHSNLTDPDLQTGKDSNPLYIMARSVASFAVNNPWLTIAGIGGLILALVVSGIFLGKETTATFFTFLIPIGILAVFLNYFVFPINTLDENLRHMQLGPGLGVSTVLIMFFNLIFILAIIDFVIGRQT